MNKENIPVITDREELYDKCENMEQLFDKYYLPLLDKHYSKIYELQQENDYYSKKNIELSTLNTSLRSDRDKYKEVIDKAIEWVYIVQQNKDNKHLEPIICTDELDELLDILKEADKEVE